jgi:hypothetical protein
VDLYIHSTIRLHGVVLNSLTTGTTIPFNLITGHGGSQGCEMLRLPHSLDNRLIDGGEVVNLMRRHTFTPMKVPDTHMLEAELTPAIRTKLATCSSTKNIHKMPRFAVLSLRRFDSRVPDIYEYDQRMSAINDTVR